MSKGYRYFPMVLLAVCVALVSPACAPHLYGAVSVRGVYSRDLNRHAYDNGYREGVEEGRSDARHHRDFSYSRHGEYRHADHGYRRDDGDREFYWRSYRAGFEAGYTEAYNLDARRDRDDRD